ncbi:MAG: metal-dependent hydrolase [Clostridiales bacterium]|nr:metal-dependent hydrolase [Clostridiales bacterium]
MTKDTHIASGLALSVALSQPETFKTLAICIVGATIGSVISDIDVTTSKSRKDLEIIISISVIAIVLCTILEAIFHLGILTMLQTQTNLFRIILGFSLFLCICCIGINTKHRTFMHSALCVIALTGIVWIIIPTASIPFCIAMLSHIFLDFFNTKRVQIFYPLKKPRIAFKLCHSSSKVSKIIFKITSTVFLLELLVFIILYAINFFKNF